ncbi:MAG TPA: hypothetical protein VFC44_23645 [Candidatus Saccharimonadales bacterium]|nr:hypothetical protein [Candidatus Saccharimonadales bacterium]
MAMLPLTLPLSVKVVLVVAEKPKSTGVNDPSNMWSNFLCNIQTKAPPPEGTQTLHDNIWLLPVADGMQFLTQLTPWAVQYDISLRVLFLDKEPDWTIYPPGSTVDLHWSGGVALVTK